MKKTIQLSFWDHLLVLIACSSSLFALGESLSKHLLANFLAVGSAVSILLGFFLSKLLANSRFLKFDAYIWTTFAFAAALFSMPLNAVLPEDGFPVQLFAGTWLSWMVLSCGLVSWRDQTLLFLCLPCLSVFALVGTFDTFAPATLLFFVFLLCSSLLYARIHQRAMIARAKLAGQHDPTLLERDSWRWMAGPEWAFVSAGAIIVFSLIFGPLLRFSLGPVAGTVKVSLPQGPNPNSPNTPSYRTDMQVGRGPVSLSKELVFRFKAENPGYFRTSFYTDYQGDGWSRFSGRDAYVRMGIEPKSFPRSNDWIKGWPEGTPLEPIENPVAKSVSIQGASYELNTYPTPGPILQLKTTSRSSIIFSPTGLAYRQNSSGRTENVEIQYLEAPASAIPGRAKLPRNLSEVSRHYLDTTKVPESVREFVRQAVKNADTDFEKATAIKRAIAGQVAYTLSPPAISPKDDSVEQFLFNTRRGYCDLFATSMVMCARVAGMPARYMVGFLVNDDGEKDNEGYTRVLGTDAHAWAEIYFEKVGWLKFDATEGAPMAEQTSTSQGDEWYRQPWAIVALASFLIVAVMGAFVFLQNRSAGRHPKASIEERILAIQAHQEFDRVLRKKTTVIRRLSQSLSEYLAIISSQLDTHFDEADAIRKEIERACYGKSEITKPESVALLKKIRGFGQTLNERPKA